MGTKGVVIDSWAAWAPGLETNDDWLGWSQGLLQPAHAGKPDVSFFPAMYRRRLSSLGKMAVNVAHRCCQPDLVPPRNRIVFASRYGEKRRTDQILDSLTRGEAISPTSFSLSVHNAVAGLYSIVTEDPAPTVSIAAGEDTFAAAWIEAAGLLSAPSAQCDSVLLVYYDEPLIEPYCQFGQDVEFPFALALHLREADETDQESIRLQSGKRTVPTTDARESLALKFFRFLLSNDLKSVETDYGYRWQWTRNPVL